MSTGGNSEISINKKNNITNNATIKLCVNYTGLQDHLIIHPASNPPQSASLAFQSADLPHRFSQLSRLHLTSLSIIQCGHFLIGFFFRTVRCNGFLQACPIHDSRL